MSRSKKKLINIGIPVFTTAALALLVLKLVGFEFSWLWIPFVWLFPLWMFLALVALVLAVVVAFCVIVGIPVGVMMLIHKIRFGRWEF